MSNGWMQVVGYLCWLALALVAWICRAAFKAVSEDALAHCPEMGGKHKFVTVAAIDSFARASTSLLLLRVLTGTAHVMGMLAFGKTFAPKLISAFLSAQVSDGALLYFCGLSGVAVSILIKCNADQFKPAIISWLDRAD